MTAWEYVFVSALILTGYVGAIWWVTRYNRSEQDARRRQREREQEQERDRRG